MNGRTVIVTGAAGGIGEHYVHAFAAAGADVVATDVPATAEAGEAIAAAASAAGPGKAVFRAGDVTSDDDWAALVALADESGGVDALINNAAIYRGIGTKRPLTELPTDEWDRVLAVNLRGTWQGIKAVAPVMRAAGGGRIVNISSSTARMGITGFVHYVASKGGVDALTRAAARELGVDGITVNAVSPGLVTDAATQEMNSADYIATAAKGRAIPREMLPGDLVGTVLFLAGEQSGFITGQTLVVDGGVVFT